MIKKLYYKIKDYFEGYKNYDDDYEDDNLDNCILPLQSHLLDYNEPSPFNYFNPPYAENLAYVKQKTTPEVFKFRLTLIKTIFKTWEKDINETSSRVFSNNHNFNNHKPFSNDY